MRASLTQWYPFHRRRLFWHWNLSGTIRFHAFAFELKCENFHMQMRKKWNEINNNEEKKNKKKKCNNNVVIENNDNLAHFIIWKMSVLTDNTNCRKHCLPWPTCIQLYANGRDLALGARKRAEMRHTVFVSGRIFIYSTEKFGIIQYIRRRRRRPPLPIVNWDCC